MTLGIKNRSRVLSAIALSMITLSSNCIMYAGGVVKEPELSKALTYGFTKEDLRDATKFLYEVREKIGEHDYARLIEEKNPAVFLDRLSQASGTPQEQFPVALFWLPLLIVPILVDQYTANVHSYCNPHECYGAHVYSCGGTAEGICSRLHKPAHTTNENYSECVKNQISICVTAGTLYCDVQLNYPGANCRYTQ